VPYERYFGSCSDQRGEAGEGTDMVVCNQREVEGMLDIDLLVQEEEGLVVAGMCYA